MARKYSISVAMATYNGEKYIKEQLDSILIQLDKNDEIIISDDGSKDQTLEIIKKYQDDRLRIIAGPKKGVKQNFANAISHCSGKYIFLSDQDDIWCPNKIDTVLSYFEKVGCDCIVHDNMVFDSTTGCEIMSSFFQYRKSRKGIVKNIIKNSYIGCCMAFNKDMVSKILPIPNRIEMHDQWIGVLAEKYGKSLFIKEKLIRYRRHGSNVSQMKHFPVYKMIRNRIVFLYEYIRRVL